MSSSFLQTRAGPMQDLEFGAIRMQYVEFAGRTAETALNEPGFQAVAKMKNRTEMGHFIERLVGSMDLTIAKHGRKGFKKFVALHSRHYNATAVGANKTTMESVKQEVRQLAKLPDAWVSQTGSSAPLNEDGFAAVVRLGRWFEMDRFVRRTAAEMLDRKVTSEHKLHVLIPFFTGKKGHKGFQELVETLKMVIGSGPHSWLAPIHEPLRHAGESCYSDCKKTGYCDWCGAGNACCEEMDSESPKECRAVLNDFVTSSSECMEVASGTRAPLSHKGLEALVKLKNNTETERFILRVIDDLGYKVTSQMSVMGLVPFYSGVKATKSFNALLEELDLAASPREGGKAWLAPKPGASTHKSDILQSLKEDGSQSNRALMFFGGAAKTEKKGGRSLASALGTKVSSVAAEEEEMAIALGEASGSTRLHALKGESPKQTAEPDAPRIPTVADFFSQAKEQPAEAASKADAQPEIVEKTEKSQKHKAPKSDGKPKATVADFFSTMR